MEAEAKIEPALKDLLTKSGAEDYIPVFAMRNVTLKQLSFMNDKELSEVGTLISLNYASTILYCFLVDNSVSLSKSYVSCRWGCITYICDKNYWPRLNSTHLCKSN